MAGAPAIIHVGDTPTVEIQFLDETGLALDISTATTREIYLEKPDGTVVTKSASFTTDGTDGKIQFVAATTDFDVKGQWSTQGKAITPADTWHTRKTDFPVNPVLG